MVTTNFQASSFSFGNEEILPYDYTPLPRPPLSEVARSVLAKYTPGIVKHNESAPEIIGLRLLDYLSSKKNYIRRKSKTFRNEAVYGRMLPLFIRAISQGRPIKLNTICLCTALCNPALVGESPYPHMASYLGFENLHKVLRAAKKIYAPGLALTLGYEGNIFKPLFFHDDKVIETTLRMFVELNEIAFSVVSPEETKNPITILDVDHMVESAFGSKSAFLKLVAARQQEAYEGEKDWQVWYEKATAPYYFASKAHKKELIAHMTKWRYTVHALKLSGGKYGGGFMQYEPDTIPFNISGRRSDRIALQLVPENPYVPHQRAIAYYPKENKWRMRAYDELRQDTRRYAPRLVGDYAHPFYYEEV